MLMPVKMHKAEKYAIDMRKLPESSRTFFMQSFGCSRKVYNLYVDCLYRALEKAGYEKGDGIPEIKFPEVTEFKKEYSYLKETDSLGLANAKASFEKAWKDFTEQDGHASYTKRALRRDGSGTEPLSFRGLKGMPKFHAKAKGHFSYTTNCQHPGEGKKLKQPTVRLSGNMLHLPKLKADVPLVLHRRLPADAVIGRVTVSMDTDGKMYASIEYTHTVMMDMTLREAAINGDAGIVDSLSFIGLDYSQENFYVDSEGRKANCPRCYRKSEEKLARLQRQLSRMVEGSKNYNRQLAKIRKLHKKIADQRRDFICQEAAYLAKTYDVVVVEDINLRAMGGALKLGKNLHDNGFGMFRERIQHKLKEKGSVLVKVDRWYPSSKTCHVCGHVNPEVVLGVAGWSCPACGAVHERDPNAAVNIREEGKRIFLEFFAGWLAEKAASDKRAGKLSAARKSKKKDAAA